VGSTTSSVEIEVIPRLVGIGKGASYRMGHMQGPPSPSKTSMLAGTSRGAIGIGVGGGRGVVGAGEGMGGGKHKFTLSHISEKTTCQPARRFMLQL